MTERIDPTKKRVVGVTVTRVTAGLVPSGYPKTYRVDNEAYLLGAPAEEYKAAINRFLNSVEAQELGLEINRTNLIIDV